MNEFGVWLRNQRNKIGLTTRELASSSEVSRSYITQVEKGYIKKPSLEIASKMLTALQVDDPKQILIQYGLMQADNNYISHDDFQYKKQQLIEHLAREMQHMDLDQLEILNMVQRNQEMFVKLLAIEKQSSLVKTQFPLKTVQEYIEFIHRKHVVERLARLLE